VQLARNTQENAKESLRSELPTHTRTTFDLVDLYSHLLPKKFVKKQKVQLRHVDLPHGGSLDVIPGGPASRAGTDKLEPSAELPVDEDVTVDLTLVTHEGEAVSEIKLGEYQVVKSQVRTTNNWKNCKYRLMGIPVSSRTCLIVQAISGICARVQKGEGGEWRLDGNLTTAGCHSGDAGRPVVQYAPLRRPLVQNGNSSAVNIPLSLARSKLEVRSVHDPELLAKALLVKHNLEAGVAELGDMSAWGTVCLMIGNVVLIPAMFLFLSSCSSRGAAARRDDDAV